MTTVLKKIWRSSLYVIAFIILSYSCSIAIEPMISAGGGHLVGLDINGNAVAVGNNNFGQCAVSWWPNLTQVAAEGWHTFGLKSDGTVVGIGWDKWGTTEVENWTDVVQIDAGGWHVVGLKSNGTVIAAGDNSYGQCNVESWTNIIQIAVGEKHTVGLTANRDVIATGANNYYQCNVNDWYNIIKVEAGGYHTVALKFDNTLIATGWNKFGQCYINDWTDITQVSAGWGTTVGLKSDGTVLAVGYNGYGQRNVEGWSDIILVAAGGYYTVGMNSIGVIDVIGDNSYNQHDAENWDLLGYVPPDVIYEDAEDESISRWYVYDSNPGSPITPIIYNVWDAAKESRVIQFQGNTGTVNGYRLSLENGVLWHNNTHSRIEWSHCYNEHFIVYVDIRTTLGQRYLYYTASRTTILGDDRYIHHGLGVDARNGYWQTFERDLVADLKDAQPTADLIEVNRVFIRGSGRVDDVKLKF